MKKIFITLMFIVLSFQSLNSQTWSALTRLTWNTGSSYWTSLAANSSSGIHVVWHDNTPGNNEIFYKRSTNSGTSWSALVRLTWNTGGSYRPSLACDHGNGVHIVWGDESLGNSEILYKRSTNNGVFWLALQRLTWNTGISRDPCITADQSNRIHVVWHDKTPGNNEIFYKHSTNNGTHWSAPKRLTWNTGGSTYPGITADQGTGIHVAWGDDTPGNSEIFYKRSTNSGLTWKAPLRMTWNMGNSYSPAIVADPGNRVHLVWEDNTPGNYEIFYKRSTDNGLTWSALKRLTWAANYSEAPSIAVDSGNGIYIVWDDDTSGNSEIYYKQSMDSGINWSGLTRMTWNTGASLRPTIALDPAKNIHVIWNDSTPGNSEIFYKNRK